MSKKTTSLAKAQPQQPVGDPTAIIPALQSLAASVASMTTATAPIVWDTVKRMEQLTKEYVEMTRTRIIDIVSSKGRKVTEAGTMRLHQSGYVLEIQPSGGHYGAKEVQALLAAKGLAPTAGMDTTIKYTVNEGKLADLIAKKKLTQDELDTCREPMSWRAMAPKKDEE